MTLLDQIERELADCRRMFAEWSCGSADADREAVGAAMLYYPRALQALKVLVEELRRVAECEGGVIGESAAATLEQVEAMFDGEK